MRWYCVHYEVLRRHRTLNLQAPDGLTAVAMCPWSDLDRFEPSFRVLSVSPMQDDALL